MDKERVAAARRQTDKQWHEALNRHPDLKSRMMNLLALVDSADVALADEAERRAQELRGMGQEALKAWAQSRAGRACSLMCASIWRRQRRCARKTARHGWINKKSA